MLNKKTPTKYLTFFEKKFAVVLIIIFILYSLSLVIFSTDGFPNQMWSTNIFPFLADKPTSEDAFYMLSLAWNLGSGNGLTYNYDLPSTGVQPLITFVYGGIAYLLYNFSYNKWDFIRVVLGFNLLLIPIFYYSFRNLLRKFIDLTIHVDYFLLLLIFFNNEIFRLFSFGLETGLYLILLTWVINYSFLFTDSQRLTKTSVIFGLLCGLAILARIDFIIVIFIFLSLLFLRRKIKIKSIFVFSLVCLAVVLPWFIYVYNVTGSVIPSSGGAQSKFISENDYIQRLVDMMIAVLTHLSLLLYSGGLFKVLVVGIIISLAFLFYLKKQNFGFIDYLVKNREFFTMWISSFFFLIPVYLLFFWASHFYIRYTSPLLIFILLLTVPFLSNKLKDKKSIIIFTFVMVSLFIAQNIYAFHLGRISNNHLISAGYIKQNYSSSVKVGAFQSGVIGYLNENVINLDGKVNKDALTYINKNNLDEYLDKSGIKVMIDWESCIHNYLSTDYLNQNWVEVQRLKNILGKEVSICLERK